MIALTTIENTIYTWVTTVLSAQISTRAIWEDQNAPQPARPYVTMDITGLSRIGDDAPDDADNAGLRDLIGDRDFTLTLNYFGVSGMAYLDKLIQSAHMVTTHDTLLAGGVIFVSNEDILETTFLEEGGSEYVERATVDIMLRTHSVDEETVPLIENANIDPTTYKDAAGSTVYTGSIEITTP